MVKIKIVKEAYIKVIKAKDLKVGDVILYANRKARVIDINERRREVFIKFEQTDEPPLKIKQFLNYYIIMNCVEEEEEIM